MKQYLIALDLGTSGTKASLFDPDGSLISSCTQNYDVHYGPDGVAEQDPEDWWKAVCRAIREITAGHAAEVEAISFSGQMMGCLPVDAHGQPLRPSIIWADTRSRQQEKDLIFHIGRDRGYEILGHRISCNYSLEKIMWLKANEPDVYRHTAFFLQAKDYMIFRMTGQFVTDYSDGSGTNGMDLRAGTWSPVIFDAADVDIRKMPPLHASTDVAGTLTHEAAAALGLPESVKVIIGGGDGPCATLGSGCIHDGQYYLTFGTSAWIAGTADEPRQDKNKVLMTFRHVIPGKFSPTGTMQAAGSSYSYIKNTFCDSESERAVKEGCSVYDLLDEMAEGVPAGSDGLLYLPYLMGERSPRWNPDASGAFLGMRMSHTKAHYIRATLEGIALNLNVILEAQREHADIHELILTGGGAKGDAVAHILADVTGCRIIRPDHVEEATSMAAAVIAGVGAGIYDGFDAIGRYIHYGEPVDPDPDNHAVYEKEMRVFNDAYEALKPLYTEMS